MAASRRYVKRIKNNALFLGFGLLTGLGRRLSVPGARRLGAILGRLAFGVVRGDRRLALKHLRIAFGSSTTEAERVAIGRESFAELGRSMFELLAFDAPGVQLLDHVHFKGLENLDRALDLGCGAIIITSHSCNWEATAAGAAEHGYPLHVVARGLYDERINQRLNQWRESRGLRVLQRGDISGTKQLLRVLRNNEVLGLLIDQDTKVPGTFVPFFGRSAWTPSAAAKLALKFKTPVLPAFATRDERGDVCVTIGEPFRLIRSGVAEADVRANTALHTAAIERNIVEHPTEWVWMHRRWKTRPSDERPRLYKTAAQSRKRSAGQWALERLALRPGLRLAEAWAWSKTWQGATHSADRLGLLGHCLLREQRRIGMSNLLWARGDELTRAQCAAILKRSMQISARNIMLYLRAPMLDATFFEQRVIFEGLEHLDAARDSGRPVILVGLHLGDWELALYALAQRGYKISLVARSIGQPLLNERMVQIRRDNAVAWIPGRDSETQVVQRLHEGEMAVAVVDQNMPSGQGIFVDLFGRAVSTLDFPARLAAQQNALIIPGYGVWHDEDQHRVVLLDPLELERSDDAQRDVRRNTRAINALIEDLVRRYPEQWLWTHRRWKLRQ
ncbi:MAG: hypothetical protein P9M14_06520 [Candidatus Alcyoniella australis]|nr:hypothetical protein [Candidatus Alcyoniella australis]